jgi:hypothetical protein
LAALARPCCRPRYSKEELLHSERPRLSYHGLARRSLSAMLGSGTAFLGPALAARAIEPLCRLWCIPGFVANDWVHAFKVLHPA